MMNTNALRPINEITAFTIDRPYLVDRHTMTSDLPYSDQVENIKKRYPNIDNVKAYWLGAAITEKGTISNDVFKTFLSAFAKSYDMTRDGICIGFSKYDPKFSDMIIRKNLEKLANDVERRGRVLDRRQNKLISNLAKVIATEDLKANHILFYEHVVGLMKACLR